MQNEGSKADWKMSQDQGKPPDKDISNEQVKIKSRLLFETQGDKV